VVEVRLDCDGDALLYRVEPRGPACHTGEESCFFTTLSGEGVGCVAGGQEVPFGVMVERLAGTIAQRHREMPEGSYTVSLIRDGPERLAQKVGEEAVESSWPLLPARGCPKKPPTSSTTFSCSSKSGAWG
jgi:phosphoribosyl-ATP pyrophosphohydrolase/phosphoribosyl-AMP cyclohydrolase